MGLKPVPPRAIEISVVDEPAAAVDQRLAVQPVEFRDPLSPILKELVSLPFRRIHQSQGDDDTDQRQPTGDVKGVDIAAEHVLCLTCYEPSGDGADSIG